MSKVSNFLKEYKKVQELARESLMGIFVEFWEKNPEVKAVVWAQYTPYFNDGETCTFSVNDVYFTNDPAGDYEDSANLYYGDSEQEGDDLLWCVSSYSSPLPGGVDQKSLKELDGFLTMSQMEPCMRSMFGEHSEVRVTREGFTISPYEHD
jgi:hypothetical protein